MRMKKLLKRLTRLFRSTPTVGEGDYHEGDYHEADYGEVARQAAVREDLAAEMRAREFGNYTIGPL